MKIADFLNQHEVRVNEFTFTLKGKEFQFTNLVILTAAEDYIFPAKDENGRFVFVSITEVLSEDLDEQDIIITTSDEANLSGAMVNKNYIWSLEQRMLWNEYFI